MGYVKDGEKRYYLEVISALALFMIIAWLRHGVFHSITNPALLLAIKIAPVLPILLIAVAVWRFYRRSDELQRQSILKTSAAASLLSMFILLAWPALLAAGLPPLTGKGAVAVVCGCYILCGAVIKFQEGRADGGTKQGFIRLTPLLFMLAYMLAFVLAVNQFLPWQSVPVARSMVGLGGMVVAILAYWQIKRRLDP
ncbi:MAG TPA: hypothetical protein VHY57_01560 [Rhizomicrobium sp.]|nr:hypothetical protein [Rhizomicrobium sp.]